MFLFVLVPILFLHSVIVIHVNILLKNVHTLRAEIVFDSFLSTVLFTEKHLITIERMT